MRLETLLAVTGGRSLNTPAVSRFDGIALSPHRVEQGSLFIAKNPHEIPEAILQGAYGVLGESPLTIADEEIAWIEVNEIARALPRLLRLWIMEHPRRVYLFSREVVEFIRLLHYGGKLRLLEGDEQTMSETLLISHPDHILVTSDTLFLEHVGLSPEPFEAPMPDLKIEHSTLFETTLVIEGHYAPRLPLPPCMIDSFRRALSFLKAFEEPWSLQRLDYTPSCRPLFVDAHLRPLPFGESERVVVALDLDDPEACIESFDAARWLERTLFLPKGFKPRCDIKSNVRRYDSLRDLEEALREEVRRSGYFVILGSEGRTLLENLQKEENTRYPTKGLFA